MTAPRHDGGRSATVPTYLALFTYEKAAWRDMVRRPEDREAAARAVIDAAGGSLLAFYWMLGDHDGLAIYEAPDAPAAAAVTAAILSSGRVWDVRTNALLTAPEALGALRRAGEVAPAYRPPGGAREDWHADFDEAL
jgi:uncharacterized protein with GYD domain